MRKMWCLCLVLILTAGCGGGGISNSPKDSATVADTTRPQVIYTAPANADTLAGTDCSVGVTFSKPMDPATITTSVFTLSAPDGSTVSAPMINYDSVNRIAQFKPNMKLSPDALYTATIAGRVADEVGNTMGANYSWTFMTGSSPDAIAPTVTSYSPKAATDVPINSQVAVVLSKPMDSSTINSSTFTLQAGGNPVIGKVSYVGTTAVFIPTSDMLPNTTYTASITTEAKDLAGNNLPSRYSWTFTTSNIATPDTVAAKVVSTSPADGAANVSVKTAISVVYDKPMYPRLFGVVDGKSPRIEMIYNADFSTEVRIIPTQDLKRGSSYTAQISMTDLTGNKMQVYTWKFATEP